MGAAISFAPGDESVDPCSAVTASDQIIQEVETAVKEKTTAITAMYEGIDLTSRGARFEPVFFLVRRTIIAALLVYLPSSPLVASLGCFSTSLAMLAYSITVRPYKNGMINNLAIANELALAVFILLVFFGDAMHGYVLIAFMMIVIFANLTGMLGTAFLNFASASQQPKS